MTETPHLRTPGKPRLGFVELAVADLPGTAEFYCQYLGMSVRAKGQDFLRLGYEGQDADLVLRAGQGGYTHDRRDRYWKVGITLPNVEMAAAQLRAKGIDTSQPNQFRDIGFMCHLTDPEGYQIELLQHTFDGNRPAQAGTNGAPLGGGARVGQITLRTDRLPAALSAFRDQFGMRLLSIQPVPDHDFTLYFLAFTDEEPPGNGPEDVANREWLWQRPYTTLELQELPGPVHQPAPGFRGIGFGTARPGVDEYGQAILADGPAFGLEAR